MLTSMKSMEHDDTRISNPPKITDHTPMKTLLLTALATTLALAQWETYHSFGGSTGDDRTPSMELSKHYEFQSDGSFEKGRMGVKQKTVNPAHRFYYSSNPRSYASDEVKKMHGVFPSFDEARYASKVDPLARYLEGRGETLKYPVNQGGYFYSTTPRLYNQARVREAYSHFYSIDE